MRRPTNAKCEVSGGGGGAGQQTGAVSGIPANARFGSLPGEGVLIITRLTP